MGLDFPYDPVYVVAHELTTSTDSAQSDYGYT